MNIHLFTWTICHTGHNMDPRDADSAGTRRSGSVVPYLSVPATIPYFLWYFPILPGNMGKYLRKYGIVIITPYFPPVSHIVHVLLCNHHPT